MSLSSFIGLSFEKLKAFSGNKTWFLLPLCILIIITLINGLGIVPEAPYQKLSENPFITRTDIHPRNNFQETLLLPIIAHYLHSTSPASFTLLCYIIIICGFISLIMFSFYRWGGLQAIIFSTIAITGPLTTVMFTWLGMPDGLTFALITPLLFTNSTLLIFFLAALGTTNHVTFIIAAMEIIFLRWWSRNNISTQHVIATLLGTFAGILIAKSFILLHRIDITPRASFVFTKTFWDWVKINIIHFPLSIFSLFNIQWLVVVICLLIFLKRDKKFYLVLSLMLAFNYGVTFFSLDTTRIFSIISFGILMICIFHSHEIAVEQGIKSHEEFLKTLMVIGYISIFSPRLFSWAGEIHTTPFYEFLRKILM